MCIQTFFMFKDYIRAHPLWSCTLNLILAVWISINLKRLWTLTVWGVIKPARAVEIMTNCSTQTPLPQRLRHCLFLLQTCEQYWTLLVSHILLYQNTVHIEICKPLVLNCVDCFSRSFYLDPLGLFTKHSETRELISYLLIEIANVMQKYLKWINTCHWWY